MICLFNKYKKSVQKRTDFFDNSFFNAVPDKPLATRNKPHNNQLCADLSRFISAYPVVSHFLRFAWQTTIARAIVNDPSVILADEPTGALDSKTTEEIMSVFENMNESSKTIIIVIHDKDIAAKCRRVIEIADGRIVSDSKSK